MHSVYGRQGKAFVHRDSPYGIVHMDRLMACLYIRSKYASVYFDMDFENDVNMVQYGAVRTSLKENKFLFRSFR